MVFLYVRGGVADSRWCHSASTPLNRMSRLAMLSPGQGGGSEVKGKWFGRKPADGRSQISILACLSQSVLPVPLPGVRVKVSSRSTTVALLSQAWRSSEKSGRLNCAVVPPRQRSQTICLCQLAFVWQLNSIYSNNVLKQFAFVCSPLSVNLTRSI